jgi:predicted naringenin-chalcone synthase
MSADNKNEIKEISFRMRKKDTVKMIQSFLAMQVTSFEKEATPFIIEISQNILESNHPATQKAIDEYLKKMSLYKDGIEQIKDLMDEHVFLESSKTVPIIFKSGEKISGTEFTERANDAFKKTAEKKKIIKKKIEKKKKPSKESVDTKSIASKKKAKK